MTRHTILALLLGATVCRPVALAAPEIPGPPQTRPIALVGATIHPVSAPPIQRGTLLFDAGRIVAVGTDLPLPPETETIDASGKHIYPGLFDAATDLGLVEIEAVRATRDKAETGRINPNARADAAFNPDSELIPVARANGILLCLSAPQGELIQGQSAVMQLDGWTNEEMALRAPAALHIDWPRTMPRESWFGTDSAKDLKKRHDEQIADLRRALNEAAAYRQARQAAAQAGQPLPRDLRWEAMLGVLEGELPVVVRADELRQIHEAVALAAEYSLRLILLGGYDAPQAADLLKARDIPVIVAGVHRMPLRRHEPYDEPFRVPQKLHAAGIRFCIGTDQWASAVRNLPYHAATAAAYGLPPEAALRAMTLSAAEICGVADRVGSLEPGKDATLIVTDGNPLETTTHVHRAYIQGRPVDLNNRHTRLYTKYQEKYRQLPSAE